MRPPLHFVIPSLLFPPSSPSSSPLYSSSSLCFFFSTPRPSFFHLVPRLYLCPFLLLFVPVSVSLLLLSFSRFSVLVAIRRFPLSLSILPFHSRSGPSTSLSLSLSLSPFPPFVSSLRLAPRLLNHFFSFSVPSPLQTSLPLTTDKHDDALLARHIRIAYTLARVQPSKKMS